MKEKGSKIADSDSAPTVCDRLKSFRGWLHKHVYVIILGVVLILAALIRLWAAAISAGPDVAQFWAFAKVFQAHGLDFYRYADAELSIFPMKGWAYVYPPVWLLISKVCLFFAPASTGFSINGTV